MFLQNLRDILVKYFSCMQINANVMELVIFHFGEECFFVIFYIILISLPLLSPKYLTDRIRTPLHTTHSSFSKFNCVRVHCVTSGDTLVVKGHEMKYHFACRQNKYFQ